nr:hypothetical protein [Tanacetum cinerariifolium]
NIDEVIAKFARLTPQKRAKRQTTSITKGAIEFCINGNNAAKCSRYDSLQRGLLYGTEQWIGYHPRKVSCEGKWCGLWLEPATWRNKLLMKISQSSTPVGSE